VFKGLAFLAASGAVGLVAWELIRERSRLRRTSASRWLFWLPALTLGVLVSLILAAAAIASFLGHGPTAL
jgi:hypothetical protein